MPTTPALASASSLARHRLRVAAFILAGAAAGALVGRGAGAPVEAAAPPATITITEPDPVAATAPAPQTGRPAPVTGVEACDAYLARLHDFTTCHELAPEARASMQQAIDSFLDGLEAMRIDDAPAATREAVADACQQASAAINQALDAMHCTAGAPGAAAIAR